MFSKAFHSAVKERRKALLLTQSQAAQRCQMTRSRWSNIECGYRSPTQDEFRAISLLLNLGKIFMAPRAINKYLLCEAARLRCTPRPYFNLQDRPTRFRLNACLKHYPELTRNLVSQVERRNDFEECEYFGHTVSCESRLEALYILHLLNLGAKPGLAAPSSFGHTRWAIVDCRGREEVGFRPRPCLWLNDCWYFFQVSFQGALLQRVDVLHWHDGWSAIEINGPWHVSSEDRARANRLELPTTFLNEAQLLILVESGLKDGSVRLAS